VNPVNELQQNCWIDCESNGIGPISESLGLTWIDWSKLREIKSADD